MGSMIEAHFCGIASQSSIYGLTSLFTGESSHKVLVASSRRKVYCIEYSKNINSVIFSTRVVQFTYIPGIIFYLKFLFNVMLKRVEPPMQNENIF